MGTDMDWIKRWLLATCLGMLSMPSLADFRVFACEPEWAALAREFMPDAQITTATNYLQDPHYIEPRPSLIAAMRRSDIAVCTGASLEAGWLPVLLERSANPNIQPGRPGLFFAADHARLLDIHDHVDRSMGDVHPEGNPHVHLSPDQLPVIAEALAKRFADLRPDKAASISARYIRWRGNWSRHRAQWRESSSALRGRSVIVQHSSFRYLLHWLGIQAPVDLEPKPGLPPSAGYLTELLTDPALGATEVILIAHHQNRKPATWLSERIDKPVLVLPATVTEESPTDTLSGLISAIVSALEESMGKVRDGGL